LGFISFFFGKRVQIPVESSIRHTLKTIRETYSGRDGRLDMEGREAEISFMEGSSRFSVAVEPVDIDGKGRKENTSSRISREYGTLFSIWCLKSVSYQAYPVAPAAPTRVRPKSLEKIRNLKKKKICKIGGKIIVWPTSLEVEKILANSTLDYLCLWHSQNIGELNECAWTLFQRQSME
jgi:hypothetical protein